MNHPRVDISAGAAMLAALLFYLARPEELAAVLLPVLIHELGHLLLITTLGLRLRGIRAAMDGFTLAYTGEIGATGQVLIAAAGPVAGFLYAWVASALGNRLEWDWLCLSAGVSLLLSIFNLLPALPLDGGQMIKPVLDHMLGEEGTERLLRAFSLSIAVLLTAGGLLLVLQKKGAALFLAGFWLFWNAMDGFAGFGLVKKGRIL